ncbi:MAG: alpha/beta hydrolase [SAR202 cluster bacterium]|nr:alpha/beta hydrolase [SAR202 cluster bacterium]
MGDYLLVSGAGLGGWAWGPVWGYMKAPPISPPRLYLREPVEQAITVNAAGVAENQARPDMNLQQCVDALVKLVKDNGLQKPVLVGHGVAAPVVLKAASALESTPRRVVLVGGVLPKEGRSAASVLPPLVRMPFMLQSLLGGGRGVKMPKFLIHNVWCSGMSYEESVKVVGRFQALPTRLLKSRVSLKGLELKFPVTYIVLEQDKLISPKEQRRMAHGLGYVEIDRLEACHAAMLHKPRELADLLLRYS